MNKQNEKIKTESPKNINDNKLTLKEIENTMSSMRDMIQIVEQQWINTRDAFDVTEKNIEDLFEYNSKHRIIPENVMSRKDFDANTSIVEKNDNDEEVWIYHHLNGLDNITKEEVIEMFGEDSKMLNIDNMELVPLDEATDNTVVSNEEKIEDVITDTMPIIRKRLVYTLDEFIRYIQILGDYRNIQRMYSELLKEHEKEQLENLKKQIEEETDPEKRKKLQAILKHQQGMDTLEFLRYIPEETWKLISVTYNDKAKQEYRIERGIQKLKSSFKLNPTAMVLSSTIETYLFEDEFKDLEGMFSQYFCALLNYSSTRMESIAVLTFINYIHNNPADNDERFIAYKENVRAFLTTLRSKLQ